MSASAMFILQSSEIVKHGSLFLFFVPILLLNVYASGKCRLLLFSLPCFSVHGIAFACSRSGDHPGLLRSMPHVESGRPTSALHIIAGYVLDGSERLLLLLYCRTPPPPPPLVVAVREDVDYASSSSESCSAAAEANMFGRSGLCCTTIANTVS